MAAINIWQNRHYFRNVARVDAALQSAAGSGSVVGRQGAADAAGA
jgi:hypothetical protein